MKPGRPGPGPGIRAWSLAVEASRALLPLAGLGSPKRARGVAARRGAVARLEAWAGAGRDPSRPAVWLHGASAGELLGAAPAVERLRERLDLQLVVTWFSPSAEAALPSLSPDVSEALPLDTLRETGRALDAVRPSALVFAKADLWPGLVASASVRGVPLGLVNGTVGPRSSRLHWPAVQLLAGTYARLDLAGAVSEQDAARLRLLGARPGAVVVTGDGAFDRAAARVREAREPGSEASRLRAALGLEGPAAGAVGPGPVLLGGSTWPRDEALLLSAVAAARAAGRPVALVLAPHEPDGGALERLSEASLRILGVRPRTWSEAGRAEGAADAEPDTEAPWRAPLVIDRVGLLAGLYAFADLAYVGGGLGTDGLHSVVEPAAAGIPVLFGRRHARRESADLLERGGALEVGPSTAAEVLTRLLSDGAERARRGAAARSYVEEGRGAAERTADLIERLVERGGG
ncbi:MAG: glycosyltransferase N-terminal domain-containing protein [Candidatus Palauibacterales bacterium]|nr:glycosyltransferase N-terminal domain-containing protein [Candidatus Palauibacterales bacterium]MDP2530648.1 glycosyltransferase N-terminal domain-containing protein [Candidatus Palauibacterales bacterium]MDP2583553.1 glycosyltransferase N-terminal domain-containing protein [Candidatus Palauibacterales bacterium]